MESSSRQDEFSFRLAQWLLDQLHSEEEFKTVTQQFNVLISQAKRDSIEELYPHIGRLIFQKFIRTNTPSAPLCAQLCRSLFMANLKQSSSLCARPVPIHEYLFQCCLSDLSSGDPAQYSRTQQPTGGASGPSATQPETCASVATQENEASRIVEVSSLILELHRYGLVSTIQAYEYMFQLTTLPQLGLSANRLSAVYTLLECCFSDLDASLWKGELELLHGWVTNLMSDTRADQSHQEGVKQLANLLHRMLNTERGPDNSEDLGQAFGRLSVSVTAQPIADELDTSTVENDGDHPPNLNNIVLNLGDIITSPLSSSHDEGGDGMGNNYGDYMHEAGSVDPLDNIINSDEADTSLGLNAGVHRPVSKRYGHIIHPFAVVDALQPESRPTRPTVLCAQHYSSSSESSFSSAGSTSTPALSASSPIPLPNAVAALILNKKQKKNRLAKVVEMQAEQQKKAKETPEKAKRSKEDTVLDWLERESATRGSLERGKSR